jgi:ribosomal protein S12 methylthiotransferase accessory factor
VSGLLSRRSEEPERRANVVKQPSADLERLMALVSSRTGVVKSLIPLVKGATDPTPPYIYRALIANHSYENESGRLVGVGKAETREGAKVRALAEAVERYCATQPNCKRSIRTSLAELGPRGLDPSDYVLYSDRQYNTPGFSYARFSAQTTMTWTDGVVLPDNEVIFVPTILVYLIRTWKEQREYICLPTSNGLAAGVTLDMAILNGLLEVVERDAFMVSWLTRRQCPHVNYWRQGGLPATIRNHYSSFGIEVVVVNITTDLPIHVMMAIAIDRGGGGPTAVIGLGAGLNPRIAVEKALLEICQGRSGEAVRYREKPPQEQLRSLDDVHDSMDHGALFSMAHMLGQLYFLLAHGPFQEVPLEQLRDHSTGDVRGDLRHCIDALVSVGSKVAYVEVTTPDISPLGLRVVQTLVTGLQPIHFGYGKERLGGRRLFEVPMKLGYSARPLTEDEINPCPHPLT